MTKQYDSWTKEQLIARIRELEPASAETPQQTPKEKHEITPPVEPKKKKTKTFDLDQHPSRFIALRFAYLGWNYNGLAFQFEKTQLPTVEEEVLNALVKAKLISSPDPGCCNFSRCGRTDKGVSAMNQVISLNVRSSLTEEEQKLKENDNKEVPYMVILNSLLPMDIKVTAVCLRPPEGFNARFSCDYRHYKYFVRNEGLDLGLMKEAAKKYLGGHDFRNFCKIDGSKQITNYRREVFDIDVVPFDEHYYVVDLKGSAFLWHQVRYMVSVLLTIAQKLEKPEIIDELLDVEKYPSKPYYETAYDIPLVLYDCVFPEMEWLKPVDFSNTFHKVKSSNSHLKKMVLDLQVKSRVATFLQDMVVQDEDKYVSMPGSGLINLGDGRGRNYKKYTPILQREFSEGYEVVNAKHLEKKKRRLQSNSAASL